MNRFQHSEPLSPHLSDERLQLLLSESDLLRAGHEHDLDHLDHCSTCQRRLQNLTSDQWWWQTVRPELISKLNDSTIDHLIVESLETAEEYEAGRFDPVKYLTARMATAPRNDFLGQIDEYLIERVIGIGGMGIVFKGYDTELDRAVAIKFLAPHLDGFDLARQRFFREAKSAAAVCHENVVRIYRIGTHRGMPFFVMPFISNDSLQSWVDRQGPLSATQLTQIAMQMTAGIAAAHEQGLVHRDVKPGNVLVENELSRVLISDFGLAHDFRGNAITATGLIAGTPGYMSPEQAAGATVEYRSDLFSLGSVLFFSATGQMPFTGDNSLLILDRIRTQQICLSEHRPDLPPALVAIVNKLMSKRAEQRFASAADTLIVLSKSWSDTNRLGGSQQIYVNDSKRTKWKYFGIQFVVSLATVLLLAAFYIATFSSMNSPKGISSPSETPKEFLDLKPNSKVRSDAMFSNPNTVTLDHFSAEPGVGTQELDHDQKPKPTFDMPNTRPLDGMSRE